MIKLYGSMASRAHRCAWMLRELNLPFEVVPTGFQDGSTRRPEFLAMNPNGRVPVLDDHGFVIIESMAINLYLAQKYGGPLAPASPQEAALAMQWSFWVVTEIEKPLILACANRFLFAEKDRSEAEAEVALNKLSRPFQVINAHLEARPWLLGERFTVADLNVATVLDLAPPSGISFKAWPRLDNWLQRCLHRPAACDWQDVKFTVPRPPTPVAMLGAFV